MAIPGLDRRFFETTRGRIVRLLRRATHTVDELAAALGLTDNAVRAHLTTLERDGLVRVDGVRRHVGAGKPATIYDIDPGAEPVLSRAYVPLLTALLGTLGARMSTAELRAVMSEVGHRLARAQPTASTADFDARLQAAARLLEELGGEATLERTEAGAMIRGCSCPISAAVGERPEVCRALETLLADLTGGEVREQCDRGERPRCRFEITAPPTRLEPAAMAVE